MPMSTCISRAPQARLHRFDFIIYSYHDFHIMSIPSDGGPSTDPLEASLPLPARARAHRADPDLDASMPQADLPAHAPPSIRSWRSLEASCGWACCLP
jgi:hypothetical protein